MKYILVFLSFLSFSAYSASKCEVIGKERSIVFVFCPEKMTGDDIAKEIKVIADQNFHHASKQVHLYVFNNKMKTPKKIRDFENMSEKEDEKFKSATASINHNSGYRDFWCKQGKKLVDCSPKFY